MMNIKANQDLRDRFKRNGLFAWQVASKVGVSESTITKWMREEMPENDERRKLIETFLDQLERGG